MLEGMGTQELLSLAKQILGVLGCQPLSGQVDDEALTGTVQRLHELETIVAAEKLRRIAEIDMRQAWRAQSARSTADLLAQRLRLTRGEARSQTETAIGLESLPATAQALRDGDLGLGQAQVAARAAKDVRPDVREDLDRLVAGDGGGMDRRQLREHVDAWTHTADPEALAGRERRAWANRRLSISADGPDGAVHGGFTLDPVGGATLIAALDAQSRKTSTDDERTYPQRLADALVALAQRALDGGELPQVAVQRPHVILITTAETLKGAPGSPAAQLDGVGPVSAGTAQTICCDAEVTEVFMTRNAEVLDVGRTRKQPTRAQRLAVIARDRRCIGCGASAARCQIHHVRWWNRDSGPTDEENLCLVCWDCHHRIHDDGWLVIRQPDRRYILTPPDPLTRRRTALN